MIRVNLIPGASPRRRSRLARFLVVPPEQRAAAFGVMVLMATAVGVAGWWWRLDQDRRRLDADIAVREAEVVRLQAAARLVEQLALRETDLRERVAVIDRLRATQSGPVRLLETISLSLPDGLWLLELKQAEDAVRMEGRAMSLTALTDFIDRLQTSGRFTQALDIVTTNMEPLGDASIVRFAIRGNLRRVPSGVVTRSREGRP